MARRISIFAVAAVVALTASNLANARGPRTGTVMTPFGPVYNTGSAEWKMAGGNPLLYQEIMEQKAMMRQQQLLIKQQQQLMKAQNGKKAAGSGVPTLPPTTPVRHRKKKRRTYDPTHPVTSSTSAGAKDSSKTAKP